MLKGFDLISNVTLCDTKTMVKIKKRKKRLWITVEVSAELLEAIDSAVISIQKSGNSHYNRSDFIRTTMRDCLKIKES